MNLVNVEANKNRREGVSKGNTDRKGCVSSIELRYEHQKEKETVKKWVEFPYKLTVASFKGALRCKSLCGIYFICSPLREREGYLCTFTSLTKATDKALGSGHLQLYPMT